MGNCAHDGISKEQAAENKRQWLASKELDNKLLQYNAKEFEVIKLLLLGAGDSGKSTLFKALMTLYGDGFQDEDKKHYAHVVQNNIIEAMKALLESEDLSKTAAIQSQEGKNARIFFSENFPDEQTPEEITKEIAGHLNALWADPGIQLTYENRSNIQIIDSAQYFF